MAKSKPTGLGLQAPELHGTSKTRQAGEDLLAFADLAGESVNLDGATAAAAALTETVDIDPDSLEGLLVADSGAEMAEAVEAVPRHNGRGYEIEIEKDRTGPQAFWPMIATQHELLNGPTNSDLDGDSHVVLVELLNVLKDVLGEEALAPFVTNDPQLRQTTLSINTTAHFARFVCRAAVPALVAKLKAEPLSEVEKGDLRYLINRSTHGSSVLRDEEEKAAERERIANAKAKLEEERVARLQVRAVEELAADERAEQDAKLALKVAELEANAKKSTAKA